MNKANLGQHPNSKAALRPMTSERAKELGFGLWMKGKTLSDETKLKLSQVRKGGNSGSFKPGIQNNPNGGFKPGHIPATKGRGTKCKETQLIRSSLAYRSWRKKVFERDEYTCQNCGVRGGHLNADHIKPFSLFPELRLDVDNGKTLCLSCHKTTVSFANNKMKKEDFL